MNKRLIYSLISAAILYQTAPIAAMENKHIEPKNSVRYYNDTPINKETILSNQDTILQRDAQQIIDANKNGFVEATSLPSKLTKQEINALVKKREEVLTNASFSCAFSTFKGSDLVSFKDKKEHYSIWFSNPVNRVFTLWHGDAQTKGMNIWDPKNRTDENFGKITVVDSYQTISARACFLALLAAKGQLPVKHDPYVKILPVYLYKFLTEENKTTDESYVAIHRVSPKAVVLKAKPAVISSIPTEALTAMYIMIMDEKSGAAGALWDNTNIAVKLDEKGNFKQWVIGLCEKPNNQRPEIFFNQDKNFHETCQIEGLRTLADVLSTSDDKSTLQTFCALLEEKKESLRSTEGKGEKFVNRIENEILKTYRDKK